MKGGGRAFSIYAPRLSGSSRNLTTCATLSNIPPCAFFFLFSFFFSLPGTRPIIRDMPFLGLGIYSDYYAFEKIVVL